MSRTAEMWPEKETVLTDRLDMPVGLMRCMAIAPRHCIALRKGEVAYDGELAGVLSLYGKEAITILLNKEDYDSFRRFADKADH
jgi:hypothetical protein